VSEAKTIPAKAPDHRHPADAVQSHDFLGARHDRNAQRTTAVLLLCAVMMAVELVGGWLFHSMALIADGLHMGTHVGVMLVAAGAYWFARRRCADPSFSFGTGKVGDLAAFASAVALASTAALIAIESVERLINPLPIAFGEAIPIAIAGVVVNLLSVWLLHDDHDHGAHGHGHAHDDHDHDHDHDHAHDHAHHDHDHDDHDDHHHDHAHHHHDHNLRAAYIHILSDAGLGVFAIIGLVAGRTLGWLWLDPLIGIVGAVVILRWGIALARASGNVLLDRVPDARLAAEIRARIERDGSRVRDFHLWRLGPGHHGVIVALVAAGERTAADYRALLTGMPTLSHVTIQVERG
jgi:cation diffusion facilitator family transporter